MLKRDYVQSCYPSFSVIVLDVLLCALRKRVLSDVLNSNDNIVYVLKQLMAGEMSQKIKYELGNNNVEGHE